MYDYIQNDIIESTVRILFQMSYFVGLLWNDVWSYAEFSYFGDEEDEEAAGEEIRQTEPGEVGDIGWEYEYEDCLTALYRCLFDTPSSQSQSNPSNQPTTLQQCPTPPPPPLPPVPYPEKYNAEWKKRIHSSEIILKEQLGLSQLKHNVLFETTPFGNVIMYYDASKDSFIYFSDKTLSYPIINAVGKKYVLTFRCESLFNDIEAPIASTPPETRPAPIPAEDTRSPTQSPTLLEKGKNVFAKFKNYRDSGASSAAAASSSASIGVRAPYKNTSTVSPTAAATTQKDEPPKNRYTCEGKLANYNFLQKIAKVKPFSYKDFKRKMNPPKVISV
jgi:hypothetical protein